MEIDLENNENGSDGEEMQLTLPQIIQLMQEGWLNELFAPEVLPLVSDDRLVNILTDEITSLENSLEKLSDTDFRKELYQIENYRLKFLISGYRRARLRKIEMYSSHILEKNQVTGQYVRTYLLNPAEYEFAAAYEQSVVDHLKWIMKFCVTSTELAEVIPNLLVMVFLKSKKDLEGIAIDNNGDGDTTENSDFIDLRKGSQVLVCYESIAHLVKNGDAHLF